MRARGLRGEKPLRRPWTAIGRAAYALACVAAVMVFPGAAVPATSGPTTESFTSAGCSTWTVPAGVSTVQIDATGAAGGPGSSANNAFGGLGDSVSGMLSGLSAGQHLFVCVAVGGGAAGAGSPYDGGQGGGASGVAQGSDFSAPMVVAGGGGGAAAGHGGGSAGSPNGGDGGAFTGSSAFASAGTGGTSSTGGAGGGSGSGSSGLGGSSYDASGPGSGGDGGAGSRGGGGGGAGYFGGGGGGGGASAGGSGGGGSDYCAGSLTNCAVTSGAGTGQNAGGSPGDAQVTLTYDNTPPETSIDSGPSGTVTTTSATFEFSSNEGGATFKCSLDGNSFTACTSAKSYAGLTQGSHTFRVRATDAIGNTDPSPASRTWQIDGRAPSSVPPAVTLRSGQVGLDGSVPAVVAIGGYDPAPGSGIDFFTLQRSNGGGSFSGIGDFPGPSFDTTLASGITSRFRSQATDYAGNTGGFTTSAPATAKLIDERATTNSYKGGWNTLSSADAYMGKYRSASLNGATSSITFTGRAAALVTATGPAMGKAQILLDGAVVATIDLYTPSTQWRQLVAITPAGAGTHTFTVKVLGSKNPASTGTAVPVDAFATLG